MLDRFLTDSIPRYCPRCGIAVVGEGPLCPECGEIAAPQGYCPVCEQHWRRPVGSDCPKHEIPLEEPEPDEGPPAGEPVVDWVRIARYATPGAAAAPRLRLEAEGIPVFLDGLRMGDNALYSVATGGVKLLVPRRLEQEARVLLAQTWAPPAEADDLDDAYDDLAPAPWELRRAVMHGVLKAMALWGVVVLGASALAAAWGLARLAGLG